MTSVDPSQKSKVLLRYLLSSPTSSYGRANGHQLLKIFVSAKSHPPIIELTGKIGHGIYASILAGESCEQFD